MMAMTEVERGFLICRNGNITRSQTFYGTQDSLIIPLSCPLGSKPWAISHTHPSGNIRPSLADITEGMRVGLGRIVENKGK